MLLTAERPPWMTVALQQQIRQKRKSTNKLRKQKNSLSKTLPRTTKTKRFYSNMKAKTSTHAEVGPLKVGGATITDSKAMATPSTPTLGLCFNARTPVRYLPGADTGVRGGGGGGFAHR